MVCSCDSLRIGCDLEIGLRICGFPSGLRLFGIRDCLLIASGSWNLQVIVTVFNCGKDGCVVPTVGLTYCLEQQEGQIGLGSFRAQS